MKKIAYLVLFTMIVASPLYNLNIGYARERSQDVFFSKGKTSAVVEGGVVRGDLQMYGFYGKKGQVLDVSVVSEEGNAVFQIRTSKKASFLQGATEEDDAKSWNGRLPSSGKYTIIVGSVRGNSSYKLHIAIDAREIK